MPNQDRSKLRDFKIMPILGLKTDVPPDDPSLFQQVGENVYLTHDVGGINFDVTRKRNTATRSRGYVQWSNSANSKATKCQGLFELFDGTNRDHIAFDNGRFFLYDSSGDPNEAVLNFDAGTTAFVAGETATDDGGNSPSGTIRTVNKTGGLWDGSAEGTLHLYNLGTGAFVDDATLTSASGAAVVNGDLAPITFAVADVDLFSMEKIGAYLVFSDHGTNRPYRWINGDDYITRLIAAAAAGENYQFKYLMSFARRLFGLYDTTAAVSDGDISIRWTDSWPGTAIDSLTFPSGNQLYIPNDDSIVGGKTMGRDRAYIYCDNSIQEIIYNRDWAFPFRLFTIVSDQGAVNHHSIVSIGGNRHLLFNKSYGFCEYRGGREFPYGGVSISADIDTNIQNISYDYYNLIVGKHLPLTNEVVWIVPQGNTTPTDLFFYNYTTKQWRIEDKPMRYVDFWQTYSDLTWTAWTNMLLGSTATWGLVGTDTWGHYISTTQKLVYSNTDGQVYTQSGESLAGTKISGYREEPILSFGDPKRKDTLEEIWWDIPAGGKFLIDVYYRGGNTTAEVVSKGWTQLGSLSCDNPVLPNTKVGQTERLFQLKWGTDELNATLQVSGITFIYLEGQTK